MDVAFRASEPFYGEKTDLRSLFDIDLDSSSTSEASREEESEVLRRNEDEPLSVVIDSVEDVHLGSGLWFSRTDDRRAWHGLDLQPSAKEQAIFFASTTVELGNGHNTLF